MENWRLRYRRDRREGLGEKPNQDENKDEGHDDPSQNVFYLVAKCPNFSDTHESSSVFFDVFRHVLSFLGQGFGLDKSVSDIRSRNRETDYDRGSRREEHEGICEYLPSDAD